MKEILGGKLYALRKSKGLSQIQVAEYLNISKSAYSRMERGITNSWSCFLAPLSKLYKIEIVDLLEEKEIRFKNET